MKLIVFLGAGALAQDQTTVNFDETTSATTQSTIVEYDYDYYNGNSSALLGLDGRSLSSNKEARKKRKEAKAQKKANKKKNKLSQPVTLMYAGTYAPTPPTSTTTKGYTTTSSTTTSTTTTTTTSTTTTTTTSTTSTTTTTYSPSTTTSTTTTSTDYETTTSAYNINPYADVPQGFEGSYGIINGYSAGYNDGTNYGNSNYGNNAQYDNSDGISCFHCDAKNYDECAKIGKWKQCPENAGVCMVEMRKRGGKIESVCMGCKQKRACLDNKKQNFNGKFWQCRPKATSGPSVCRQCCKDGEQCENFDGVNYKGWNANLLQ